MTPEQWETVRLNHEAVKRNEAALMRLLDHARLALGDEHPLTPEIRQALGLMEKAA